MELDEGLNISSLITHETMKSAKIRLYNILRGNVLTFSDVKITDLQTIPYGGLRYKFFCWFQNFY